MPWHHPGANKRFHDRRLDCGGFGHCEHWGIGRKITEDKLVEECVDSGLTLSAIKYRHVDMKDVLDRMSDSEIMRSAYHDVRFRTNTSSSQVPPKVHVQVACNQTPGF